MSGGSVRGDAPGAATAWALIVPECVAYAQIAGVPPQNAFYAAPVALVAYVLVGRSRFLIIGATSAAVVLSGATVADISSDPKQVVGLSAALAVIAGGVLLAAGLARLGFITNFLAEPAPVTVVLDLGSTYRLGVPVLDVLDELRDALDRRRCTLHLAVLCATARRGFARHPLADRLGPAAVHASVANAVADVSRPRQRKE
ncbi:SulP family inorganic anion transporter [Streptomyces sp. NPDC006134]|uniref:SulP family inorganic anion transporter n=1 Tax=Streptomyces sp. NPDC006134 TaxID=3154467 RepID=UPI0033D6C13D